MTEASNSQESEKKDVVPSQYRDKYKETGGTCGDFIAVALQKVSKDGAEGLNSIKRENGIEADRWSGFNPGMVRMNLANVLRGRFLKGETVIILGKHHNAKDQVEADFNGKVHDDHKTLLRIADFLNLQQNDRTVASLQALFFPKAKGPTAEERAAAKALKDQEKADAKAAKDKEKSDAKALKDAEADKAKVEKSEAAVKVKADKESAAALAKSEAAEEKAKKAADAKAAKEQAAAAAKAAKEQAAAAAKAEKGSKPAK